MSVTEEAILTVMSLMHEDFEKAGVMTESVRREVVLRLLTEEDIISEAIGKYDVVNLIDSSDAVQNIMTDQVGHPVHLFCYLTPDEQMSLVRNNRDIRLNFEGGQTMSHALAFAQRVIDTQRCLRYLGKNGGEIIDIGGNYASHKRSARICHSCTLVDSVREHHRQVERLVNLQSEYRHIDDLQYCTKGVQNCSHKAIQSMSIHAMPEIPWEDWPGIMDRHGLAYHIAVFHYDPVMLTQTAGKLEGSDMHFIRDAKSVKFHFENDSSLGYEHDWDNFLKYLSPWCQVSEHSVWAYIYDIKSVSGGILTAEIVRVPKSAIGRQVKKPFHAYTANETVVKVKSVIYDIETKLPNTDPAAYIPIEVIIDRDMYKFMMMYGIANDTASPNKPMDIGEFRSMLMVYNHTRKFGELVITAKKTIKAIGIEYIVIALYHVMVRERSMLEVKSKVYTDSMMKKQRLPNISWATVMAMVPLIPIAAPFVMIGSGFKYYLDKFSSALKVIASGKAAQYEVSDVPSYVRLAARGYAESDGYHVDSQFSFNRPPYMIQHENEGHRSIQGFEQHLLADTSSIRPARMITDGSTTAVDSQSEGVPVMLDRDGVKFLSDDEGSEQSEADYSDHTKDRGDMLNSSIRSLYGDEFEHYRDTVFEHISQSKDFVVVEPGVNVHENYKEMMNEYAIYSFDCGSGVLSSLKRECSRYVPGGQVHRMRLRDANAASDFGGRVFEVQNGVLPLEAGQYSVGVDPVSLTVHAVSVSKNERAATVKDRLISQLYVDNSAKVFNHMLIGKAVIKSSKSNWVPTFQMSLVDGVPGCGKTTEIVNSFDLTSALVCTVRHSKDDSLARLMADERFADHHDLLKARVRTVDSVIRNGFHGGGRIKVLFVDEGLMMFPGQLYAVAERIRPEEVRVFGDSLQIRAIDRSPTLGVLMYSTLKYWNKIEYRDVSQSMPADVTYLLGKHFYHRKIMTKSPVKRSLKLNFQPSREAVCYTVADHKYDYLSILVGDKNKLLSSRGFVDGKKLLELELQGDHVAVGKTDARVFTVHESQGQRLDRTALVRMNPQTCDVLKSAEHIVVALSRHYFECVYNVVVPEDELVKIMSTQLSDEQLSSVMLPPDKWLKDKVDKLLRE